MRNTSLQGFNFRLSVGSRRYEIVPVRPALNIYVSIHGVFGAQSKLPPCNSLISLMSKFFECGHCADKAKTPTFGS